MLQGTKSNRAAIGARVKVTFGAGGKERSVYRTVGFGSSFGGNPLRQHVGLGTWNGPVSVEVRWPRVNGITQHFNNLLPDRFYRLTEEEREAKPVALRSFPLPKPALPQMDMQNAGP
jgi:hypothetical protein